MKKIGILAVQGAFIEHEKKLVEFGCECVELRQKSDICSMDGLILPGGESTVQGKLLHELQMYEPIRELITANTPVLGTCAGLILLAEHLSNDPTTHLGTLPVTVKRNAYGRQLGSFHCIGQFDHYTDVSMTFIRAPYIESVAAGVSILATVDGHIVAVRSRNQLGISFHPELDEEMRVHSYFLDMK